MNLSAAPPDDTHLVEYLDEQGPAVFAVACYCSVPTSLTADLVQTIRVNTQLPATWEDAIRFLLTGIVRNLGDGRFEMPQRYRNQFSQRLPELDYESDAAGKVARVLLEYYGPILEQGPEHPDYQLARIQELTAYAYLDADYAYRELREEFSRLAQEENPVERVRLANLVELLEPQFAEHYEELVYYAKSWRFEVQQNKEELRAALAPLVKKVSDAGDTRVPMPVPEDMYRSIRAEQIAEDPLAEADRRIKEFKEKGARLLDLSGIGLQSIPEEVFSLQYLKQLDISRNPINYLTGDFERMAQLEVLEANRCQLWALDRRVFLPEHLRELRLEGNQLRNLPRMKFRPGLELFLDNNQFSSVHPSALGVGLDLYLGGNPIDDDYWANGGVEDSSGTPPIQSAKVDPTQNIQQSVPEQQYAAEGPAEFLVEGDEKIDQDGLKNWQRELERGENRLVKAIVWSPASGDLPGIYAKNNRLILQNWTSVAEPKEEEDYFSWKASLQSGVELGLAANVAVLFFEISHSGEDIPVSAFFSKHSVLTINLGDTVSEIIQKLEGWTARIPAMYPQRVAVWTADPEHSFFKKLATELPRRQAGVTELAFFNPHHPVGYEKWVDFLHPAGRTDLTVLNLPEKESLGEFIRRSANENPMEERDFSLLNPTLVSPGSGDDYPHWNWEQLLDLGEVFRVAGSYKDHMYLSGFQLIGFFMQVRRERQHEWLMTDENYIRSLERDIPEPGLRGFLDEQFRDRGWLRESPRTPELLLLPADIPRNSLAKPALSEKTFSVLEIHFEYLPPEVFRMLGEGYVSEEEDASQVTRDWIFAMENGVVLLWEYHPDWHRIDLTTDNGQLQTPPDEFMTDRAWKALHHLLASEWPDLKYELWIKSKDNPTRYHVGTVKHIQRERAFPQANLHTDYRRYFTSLYGIELEEPREENFGVATGGHFIFASRHDYELGQQLQDQLRESLPGVQSIFPDISPDHPEARIVKTYSFAASRMVFVLTKKAWQSSRYLMQVLEMLGEAPEGNDKALLLVEVAQELEWSDWLESVRDWWEARKKQVLKMKGDLHEGRPENSLLIEWKRAGIVLEQLDRLDKARAAGIQVKGLYHYQRYGINWLLQVMTGEASAVQVFGRWKALVAVGGLPKLNDLSKLEARISSDILVTTGVDRATMVRHFTYGSDFPHPAPNQTSVFLAHQDEPSLAHLEGSLGENQTQFELILLYEAFPNPAVRVFGKQPDKLLPFPTTGADWDRLAWAIAESGNRMVEDMARAPDNDNWLYPNALQKCALTDLYKAYRSASFYRKREENIYNDIEKLLERFQFTESTERSKAKPAHFNDSFLEILTKPIGDRSPTDPRSQQLFAERMLARRVLVALRSKGVSVADLEERLRASWSNYMEGNTGAKGAEMPDFYAVLGFPRRDIPAVAQRCLPEERAWMARHQKDQ